MQLLGLLGVVGLALALVGIFGTTAFAVGCRTREIGVRMALGARPDRVVRAMVADAAWPIGAGLAIGLAGGYFASQLVATFLFETSPRDALTFAAAAALLAGTSLAAAWIPASRAARVDPVVALRAE
jgi:ABC-type antimicrobial peptide transport system permease subunit